MYQEEQEHVFEKMVIIFCLGDLESLKLDEEVEWKQNDGSSIYVKCTLCTNEGKYTINI